jgi:hypothetical protein
MVIIATAAGTLYAWHWPTDDIQRLSSPAKTQLRSIHALATSSVLSWSQGHVWYSCQRGSVREIDLTARRRDSTLIAIQEGQSAGGVGPITNLHAEANIIYFSMRHRVYACQRERRAVVGVFTPFRDPDVPDSGLDSCQRLQAAGSSLLLCYSRTVYFIDRKNTDQPLSVQHAITLPFACLSLTDFGLFKAVVALQPSLPPNRPSGHTDVLNLPRGCMLTVATQQESGVWTTSNSSSQRECATCLLYCQFELVLFLGEVHAFASCFADQDHQSHGYNDVAHSHLFLLSSSSIVTLRLSKYRCWLPSFCLAAAPDVRCEVSEQVLTLLKRGQHATAQHICQQRLPKKDVLLEVSLWCANRLWKLVLVCSLATSSVSYGAQWLLQGYYREAMAIYGEQVLPLAPATYWRLFLERLLRSQQSSLAIKYLPFSDKSKV